MIQAIQVLRFHLLELERYVFSLLQHVYKADSYIIMEHVLKIHGSVI